MTNGWHGRAKSRVARDVIGAVVCAVFGERVLFRSQSNVLGWVPGRADGLHRLIAPWRVMAG